ncbi:MAG: YecA family protein [Gammaproteobacteria bacterium]|nr:YecA family protein [Gammaproteobacteria bacterium]
MTESADPFPAPLTDAETERLRAFLDSAAVPEESLDFLGAHGFLTALAVAPRQPDPARWLPELFGGEPRYADRDEATRIPALLQRLSRSVALDLYHGQPPRLPCPLELGPDPDQAPLADWCSGFMEGVFLDDSAWFAADEERVAELTLPMMMASGLFDEDRDLERLRRDPRRSRSMVRDIPDLLVDLYLLLHAPAPNP